MCQTVEKALMRKTLRLLFGLPAKEKEIQGSGLESGVCGGLEVHLQELLGLWGLAQFS